MTRLTKLFNFNEVSFDTASNNGGNEMVNKGYLNNEWIINCMEL